MSRIRKRKLPGLVLFLGEQALRASSSYLEIFNGDLAELDVSDLSPTLR